MRKKVEIGVSKFFYKRLAKPLRSKKDLLIILLDTIRLFYVNDFSEKSQGRIVVVVDKMSRVFYEIKDKVFSIAFPFYIEITEDICRVYDINSEMEIDNKMISLMMGILEAWDSHGASIEKIYDSYCNDICEEEDYVNVDSAWKIIETLFSTELGYIRYDYDEEHQKGELHPLNHLDINYSKNCTYKIGLKSGLKVEELVDIIDIKTKCKYLV